MAQRGAYAPGRLRREEILRAASDLFAEHGYRGASLANGIDVVYVGEGSISRGYPVDPDPEVIGYQDQFDRFELSSPGWFHAESDSGPGSAALDPGRSLRWAKVSAEWLRDLRADKDRDDCEDDDHAIAAVTAATSRTCLALLLAAAIIAIAAAGSAWAHGDPASHYLETDALYPSFARQPSVEVQLQLLGLLQATERRGYPIKVALVAGAEDLVDDLSLMRAPQRYAGTVASTLSGELEAPVLVVTPFGIGVAGNGVRHGVLRPITARDARRLVGGLEVPADPDGDELARTAMVAVRRVARAAGKPLPARVAPARQVVPPAVPAEPAEAAAVERGGGGSGALLWAVPVLRRPSRPADRVPAFAAVACRVRGLSGLLASRAMASRGALSPARGERPVRRSTAIERATSAGEQIVNAFCR